MEHINKNIKIKKMLRRLSGHKDEDYHIKIPPFQRESVWNDSDVEDLLFSLKEGFPIGAISVKNVTVDNGNGKDYSVLLDGLQRHTSLRKISLKPYNYIGIDLIKSELEKEKISLPENDIKKFDENKKELFADELFAGIIVENDLERLTYGMEYSDDVERTIKNIHAWINDEMLEIDIPHIMITKSNDFEESRTFTLINKKGKSLTSFEANASDWSNNPIRIETTNSVIDRFHNKRTSSYYEVLGIEKDDNGNLNDYDNRNILPSNFMLATFIEAITPFPNFKSLFFNDNEILKNNSIEPMMNIIKYSIPGLTDEELKYGVKELGSVFGKYIKKSKQIDDLIETMGKAFRELEAQCRILRVLKSNKQGKYNLKLSSWLFAVLVIHVLIKKEDETLSNFKQWIIYEILKEDNYNSGTKSYAKKVIDNRWYFQKVDDVIGADKGENLHNWLISKLELEVFDGPETPNPTKFSQVVLGIIQSEYIGENELSLDIDHLLPKETMKKIPGINLHSLFNLSLLNSDDNRIHKNKFLEKDTLQKYDFIYRNVEFIGGEKAQYEKQFNTIREKSYLYEIDENGQTIKSKKGNGVKVKDDLIKKPIIDFLRLRKKYILLEIEKIMNS